MYKLLLKNFTLIGSLKEFIVVENKNGIYFTEVSRKNLKLIFEYQFKIPLVIRRALRLSPSFTKSQDNNYFCLSFKNKTFFYIFKPSLKVELFKIYNQKTRFLKPLIYKKQFFYGSYYSNPSRENCKIFKYDFINDKTSTICELENIRHIHNFGYWKAKNCFFIFTGDDNSESRLIFLNKKDFSIVGEISIGQTTRYLCYLISDEKIFLFQDSEHSVNAIFSIDPDLQNIRLMSEVDNPIFDATLVNKEIFFSTNVEPNSRSQKLQLFSLEINSKTNLLDLPLKKKIFEYKILNKKLTRYFSYSKISLASTDEKTLLFSPISFDLKTSIYILKNE